MITARDRLLAAAAEHEESASAAEAKSRREVRDWWAEHHKARGLSLKQARAWHAGIPSWHRQRAADLREVCA